MSQMRAMAGQSAPVALRAAARTDGPLTVDLQRELRLDADDTAALGALGASRPSVAVFLSNAWLSGFLAEPPAGADAALVLFRQGGALRGMVPIAVHEGAGPVRVTLLGGGLGSDRTDLVADRGL